MPARIFLALAAAILAAGAQAQTTDLAAARKAGFVGERFDGYMGFAPQASTDLRRQVAAINIRRRSLYTELAAKRGVTVQVAGLAAGCELLSRVAEGELYMLADAVWRRRNPGQAVPLPGHCPG